MKTYCRRFGVIAYQNTQDNTPLFKKYFKKVKDLELNISGNSDKLKIKIFSEDGYEKTFYLYQNDWLVFESGKFAKYTDKEFKKLFREI